MQSKSSACCMWQRAEYEHLLFSGKKKTIIQRLIPQLWSTVPCRNRAFWLIQPKPPTYIKCSVWVTPIIPHLPGNIKQPSSPKPCSQTDQRLLSSVSVCLSRPHSRLLVLEFHYPDVQTDLQNLLLLPPAVPADRNESTGRGQEPVQPVLGGWSNVRRPPPYVLDWGPEGK